MKRLDWYLFKAVLAGSILALLVLMALDWVFVFLGKTSLVQHGGMGWGGFIVYTLLGEPKRIYQLLPSAVLIGALLNLGRMAANSELVAMRASGMSILRISRALVIAGGLLAVFAFFLGEYAAPAGDQAAAMYRASLEHKALRFEGRQNIWMRQGRYFLHVQTIFPNHVYGNIEVYAVGQTGDVTEIIHAQRMSLMHGQWVLQQGRRTQFSADHLTTTAFVRLALPGVLPAGISRFLSLTPEEMRLGTLVHYIGYLQKNHLNSSAYQLAFWQRITIPLSLLVMLMLALPFVFGSARSGGAGQRLFLGIVIGLVFYFANRLANQFGLVYGISPVISASAPVVLFFIISLFGLYRVTSSAP